MMNSHATHFLIRHHEISLKGKNRPQFEKRLIQNIKRLVGPEVGIKVASGRLVVEIPKNAENIPHFAAQIARLGGIVGINPCALIDSPNPDQITTDALAWAQEEIQSTPQVRTFAVRLRRINKHFPIRSLELEQEIGSKILSQNQNLKVNLKRPDLKLNVEIRQKHALIYSHEIPGAHGLPLDSTQRVVCLLSGGIDSPVAAHSIMVRGCSPILLHFHSKPFTSEASIDKVKRLAAVLRSHSPIPLELWLVSLLPIQKVARDLCNERHRTIHYRRFMMRIAQEIANRRGAKALVTGDALGQVASQTLTNLGVIEEAIELPVLRPLITSDKADIVTRAQSLGSYAISIEPHDDTCILFAPKKPATQAQIASIKAEDEMMNTYQLVFEAVDSAEKIKI